MAPSARPAGYPLDLVKGSGKIPGYVTPAPRCGETMPQPSRTSSMARP